MVRKLGERAGFGVRPHGLRHGAITELPWISRAATCAACRSFRVTDLRTLLVYHDNRLDLAGDVTRLVDLP
jgi:integrase/recombinase XerC